MSLPEKVAILVIVVGAFIAWSSVGALKVFYNSRKSKTSDGRRYGR